MQIYNAISRVPFLDFFSACHFFDGLSLLALGETRINSFKYVSLILGLKTMKEKQIQKSPLHLLFS